MGRKTMRIEDISKIFQKLFRPWKNRILLLVGRGILLATKDSTDIQQLQVTLLAGEVKDQVELMGHFGLASHAPKNSDVVMLSVGGNRDHGIVISTESREFRFKNLGEGEVALYSKDGDYVHLKNGNVIDIKTKTLNIDAETAVNITSPDVAITATGGVNITTPEITASKKITAGDDIESSKNVKAGVNVEAAVNVVATTAVQAPAMAAATSLTVAGQELNDYENHTHNYQDTGAPSNPSTTGGVN